MSLNQNLIHCMACLNYPPHVAPRVFKKFNHPYTKKKRGASLSLVPLCEASRIAR